MKTLELTFDVEFHNSENSNAKGFELSKADCIQYIKMNNGTNNSYFADYKGDVVQVVQNITGLVVYQEKVK